MAALGFALLPPFHKLSRRALSFGDSTGRSLLLSEPALLLLANDKPRDWARGRPGVVGD